MWLWLKLPKDKKSCVDHLRSCVGKSDTLILSPLPLPYMISYIRRMYVRCQHKETFFLFIFSFQLYTSSALVQIMFCIVLSVYCKFYLCSFEFLLSVVNVLVTFNCTNISGNSINIFVDFTSGLFNVHWVMVVFVIMFWYFPNKVINHILCIYIFLLSEGNNFYKPCVALFLVLIPYGQFQAVSFLYFVYSV